MITQVAKVEFDNTDFIANVKESIQALDELQETQVGLKSSMKSVSNSINSISAAKPVAELLELQQALKNIALPGQTFANFDKIFTGAANPPMFLSETL